MVRLRRLGERRVRGDACLARPGDSEGPQPAMPPMQGSWALAYALLLALGAVPAVSAEQMLRPALVEIPAGAFDMGSDRSTPGAISRNERPVHRVTISAFRMAATEVTQAQFEAVMGFNPSHFKGANLPVGDVGWYEVVAYANALSRREGLQPAYRVEPGSTSTAPQVFWDRQADGYRLPTEAEWEYAARAGSTTDTYAGDLRRMGPGFGGGCEPEPMLDGIGWHCGNAPVEGGMPVGRLRPNAWGLHDMLGNVWEWVWDWDDNFVPGPYSGEARADPTGKPGNGPGARLLRGGSWYSSPPALRASMRIGHVVWTDYSHIDYGFRIARNAGPAVPLPQERTR